MPVDVICLDNAVLIWNFPCVLHWWMQMKPTGMLSKTAPLALQGFARD